MIISTHHATLRSWRDADRDSFAAMHADPEVMSDYGGPLSRSQSDAKFDRYATAFEEHGFCRWAIERGDGEFLGYTGVMPSRAGHPLGRHCDIGWRLVRRAWGHGHATEAAAASLRDVFERVGLKEVLAYTARNNLRSQAVMERLRLQREPLRDFADHFDDQSWHGLVWIARPNR